MRVWVVMPCINCLSYTQAAIDSMRSNLHELHLLVIDNASTDGTVEYLSGLGFGAGAVQVLQQQKNIGVAASWNLGIATALEAGAERVIVANNDIVCAPDTIDNLVAWTTQHLPFVTATAIRGGQLQQQVRAKATRNMLDFCLYALHPIVIERVGWFDESFWPAYWEDRDYEVRMRQNGVKVAAALDALVQHVGSRSIHEGGVKNAPHYADNRRRFIQKHPHAGPRFLK